MVDGAARITAERRRQLDAEGGPEWDKREKHDRIRQLEIAGALIAAEIDRLQRLAATAQECECSYCQQGGNLPTTARDANDG